MPSITLYYRSDSHTINGLEASKLLTSQSGSSGNIEINDGGEIVGWEDQARLRIKSDIYQRLSGGSEVQLGSNVAIVSRDTAAYDTTYEGIHSVTWACPETALNETDAIKIIEKVSMYFVSDDVPIAVSEQTRTFITEQLATTQLDAAVWTFYKYPWLRVATGSDAIGRLYYDTATHNTRITNVTYQADEPEPPVDSGNNNLFFCNG